MNWYETNPNVSRSTGTAGMLGEMRWDAHVWARSQAPEWMVSNMAAGGFSRSMFPASSSQAMGDMFKVKVRINSAEHIRRLEELKRMHPDSKQITNALEKARKGAAAGKIGQGVFGRAMGGAVGGVGFMVGAAIFEAGSGADKARAATKAGSEMIGFAAGAKVGGALGGTIGTAILPGLGSAVGAIVGAVAGGLVGGFASGEASDFITRIPDKMVERARSQRRFSGWVNDQSAFQTRRAATMRQLSLQAMNRGHMSARSMLGSEGMMLHQ